MMQYSVAPPVMRISVFARAADCYHLSVICDRVVSTVFLPSHNAIVKDDYRTDGFVAVGESFLPSRKQRP